MVADWVQILHTRWIATVTDGEQAGRRRAAYRGPLQDEMMNVPCTSLEIPATHRAC